MNGAGARSGQVPGWWDGAPARGAVAVVATAALAATVVPAAAGPVRVHLVLAVVAALLVASAAWTRWSGFARGAVAAITLLAALGQLGPGPAYPRTVVHAVLLFVATDRVLRTTDTRVRFRVERSVAVRRVLQVGAWTAGGAALAAAAAGVVAGAAVQGPWGLVGVLGVLALVGTVLALAAAVGRRLPGGRARSPGSATERSHDDGPRGR